jgi:hypothetical protein
MTIHALPIKPADLPSIQVESTYIVEKHDCTSLAEFDPELCPPCLGCNHCSERHQDLPIGRGVCDAPGCECFHLVLEGDCEVCSGTGTVADSNDREYECPRCGGHGVVA